MRLVSALETKMGLPVLNECAWFRRLKLKCGKPVLIAPGCGA
jgi:hypothetical protein